MFLCSGEPEGLEAENGSAAAEPEQKEQKGLYNELSGINTEEQSMENRQILVRKNN